MVLQQNSKVAVWGWAKSMEEVSITTSWNTADPNLFNKEGLPASTFRTDEWPVKIGTAKVH